MMRSMRFTCSPNEFGSYNSPEAEDKTLIKLKRVGNVEARRENGLGKQHSFRLTEVGDRLPQNAGNREPWRRACTGGGPSMPPG